MNRAVLLIAMLICGAAFSAAAQQPEKAKAAPDILAKTVPAFQCLAETEGQLTCQAGRQCRCVFKPGVKATGLPDRWAWDCGIQRPACEVVPADADRGNVTIPAVIVDPAHRRKKKDEDDE